MKKLNHLFVSIAFAALIPVICHPEGKPFLQNFQTTVAGNKPVKVFILAGQSNAVGYNHIREFQANREDFMNNRDKLNKVIFWPGGNAMAGFAGTWTTLQPGVSDISDDKTFRNGCFGPEIGFSLGLMKAMPGEKIAVIKYAEGGTGIARSMDYSDYIPSLEGFDDKGRNWHPPGDGKEAGLLYRNLTDNIGKALRSLEAEDIKYEISGFIWMQGEHEAGISRKMAGDYGSLLTSFIKSVRRDLDSETLPFVIGEINSHDWAFGDQARKSQKDACRHEPDCLLVKTTDLSRDGVGGKAHFDADGMLTLGYRFSDAMITLLLKREGSSKAPKVSFKTLLQEMTDRERIARWPSPEFRLLQVSSYDRRSVAYDQEGWFANNDWSNYIRKEINQGREEYVLMDAEGPGAITRFWVAGHPNRKNNFRFYIDGQVTPFWEADHTGALIGQNKSIGLPLSQRSVDRDSLNINKGAQPGHNLYAPVPFARRIKITSDLTKGDAGTGFWYNISYRIYTGKVHVESFSIGTPLRYAKILKKTSKKLNHFMEQFAVAAFATGEKKLVKSSFSLDPDTFLNLSLKGPAAVRRILISLNPDDPDDAVKNLWLQIGFDGKQTVDVPVGFFFGCGDQLVPAKDWYRKVDQEGIIACFWVMPYRQEAAVALLNKGNKNISGLIQIATGDWQWDDRSMYFHAGFKRPDEMPAKTTIDFNYIDLKNQTGVYAGDILQVIKSFRGWWGEGDEKIYIDGSTFPDHFGTGSEDYYGYAWGHPETFCNIFNGQPLGNANTGEGGTTVNSRVRSLDAIPFKTSFRFDMESWQLHGGPVNYSLACYWYQK